MALFRRDRAASEVRDPTAATRSLQWTTPGRAQPPQWNANLAFERAYYSNIAVYACFQAIAATVSSLPFRVGPDPDKPGDYDQNAPLAKLLGPPPGGPNPGMSAEEWWFFEIIQYLATGRLGSEIETDDNGKPVALWPLVSANLNPIPSTQGTAWFTGYEYGRPGEMRRLPTDRVFYAWQPRGSDFRQPESALEAAALDVSIAVMQSRYDYAFLKNDARPAALVVTEEFADEDDFEAFKGQWNASYGGPQNAGRSAFVEAKGGAEGVKGAVDVTVLGISPKDAQAAQRYSDRLQQIAIGLGVPWSRLDASGRTFDNASQEDLIWWEQRLNPLIRRLQSAVNIQLAPRLGNLVGWFDLSGVRALQSKPEPVTQRATADVLVNARILTPDEARADYGLPPLPNGAGANLLDEAAAAPSFTFGAAPAEVREPAAADLPTPDAPVPALVVDHELRRKKLWTTANGKVRNLERQWERALKKLFARQARSAIARLEGKRGRALVRSGEVRATVDEIFDPDHWLSETEDDVTALYESVVAAGGARVSDLFGLAFDLEAPYAQDFIRARANQLAGQVTETTYAAIKDALAAGVGEGEGIPELAERVKSVFDIASKSRATLISRTEVISAFNGSAHLTAVQYGTDVVAGKEWIATHDDRVRPEHLEMDGEIVGINEPFSNGEMYPGDFNERCTVAFLAPEDMDTQAGRSVPLPAARAVLTMVRPGGTVDERAMRDALRAA